MQTIQNIYPTSFIQILILIYQKICFQTDKFVESGAYQAHNHFRYVCEAVALLVSVVMAAV